MDKDLTVIRLEMFSIILEDSKSEKFINKLEKLCKKYRHENDDYYYFNYKFEDYSD